MLMMGVSQNSHLSPNWSERPREGAVVAMAGFSQNTHSVSSVVHQSDFWGVEFVGGVLS